MSRRTTSSSEQGQQPQQRDSLQRGQACLPCRRKKMRCDAQRPTCSQCLSSTRPQDCEYTDSASRSYTNSLEEEVRRLEAHVLELTTAAQGSDSQDEDGGKSGSGQRGRSASRGRGRGSAESVRLSDPWEGWRRREEEMRVERESSLTRTAGLAGAEVQGPVVPGSRQDLINRLLAISQTYAWWEEEDPSQEVSSILINIFLPHARHLGFGLNIQRLLESMGLSLPSTQSIVSPTSKRSPLIAKSRSTSTMPALTRVHETTRRPHSSLLSAIYLWALHLTQHPLLTEHIPLYLLRATTRLTLAMAVDQFDSSPYDSPSVTPSMTPTAIARTLSGTTGSITSSTSTFPSTTRRRDGHRLVQAAQTEVLLAQWFFAEGRLLEGHYHSSAAASLAISCKLYQIRSADSPPSSAQSQSQSRTLSPSTHSQAQFGQGRPGSTLGSIMSGSLAGLSSLSFSGLRSLFELEEPRDAIEENERIDVFWSIFNMDRCWSVVVGSPVIISDEESLGTRIDTPWPVHSVSGKLELPPPSTRTLQNFFAGVTNISSSTPGLALRAQASALFERASRLVSQRTLSTSIVPHRRIYNSFAEAVIPNTPGAEREFNALATLIQSFLSRIPALETPILKNLTSEDRRQLLTTHHLTHSALIQLHHVRADTNFASYNVCINAARGVVNIARSFSVSPFAEEILDPVVVTAWMATARILVHENARWSTQLASAESVGDGSNSNAAAARSQLEGCRAAIVQFRESLTQIGRRCPLLTFPVSKALEILEEVAI